MRLFARRPTITALCRRLPVALLLGLCVLAHAQTPDRCQDWAARIISLEGAAQWRAPGTSQWQNAGAGFEFCVGDTLRIQDSRATLRLPNATVVRLQENTTLKFLPPQKSLWVELLEGIAHFITRTPQPFEVKAPYFNAAIKGTEFSVSARSDANTLALFEGQVQLSNAFGQLSLQAGESALARTNTAPQKAVSVKLRDTVAWALYFPPMPVPASAPETVRTAIAAGRLRSAEDALAELPPAQQSAELLALAAALSLYRGQVEASAGLLDRALQKDPQAPAALALKSLRQMVAGDTAAALRGAQATVAAAPDSPAAWLALSYVQQSLLQLDAAFASAQNAEQRAGDSGLLQARLAELALMLGEYKKADRFARRAAALSPNLSRTHTVAGFAALNRFALSTAQQSFRRAAQLDAADPLPALGLGLIAIREGRLRAGREHIEHAIAQDPGNAVLRSYLGKAYYEERRNELADEQYTLAQQLDPADPTPWFYQALRQQSDNRLIEALAALDTAVARNDNRAVYRSRLLLDNDNASRSANQARIYSALRFDQAAILQGARAVRQAPAEHSGHRLLAEVYADQPQLESLRAGATLMATLLAPPGAQPLPLGLRETGLLVVDGAGPTDLGVAEYNPLFIREGLNGRLSGLGGTQDTHAYEWNLNGLLGKGSFNAGQYRYQSDGFRANNDVKYELSNVLGQYQVTPDLGLQLELRRREEERGDIALQFDLDTFSDNLQVDTDTDTVRLGLNYRLSPGSRILASLTRKDTEIKTQRSFEPFPGLVIDQSSAFDTQTEQADLQYHLLADNSTWILGGRYADSEGELNPAGVAPSLVFDTTFESVYAYSFWPVLSDRLTLTAALSYTDYEQVVAGGLQGDVEQAEDKINPKLGLEWSVAPGWTLRGTALRTFAPSTDAQVSIEPGHVAGFAQVYDDSEGTAADVYGAAADYAPRHNLKLSLEYVERDLEVPNLGVNVDPFDIDNEILKASVYYALNDRVALALNYRHEVFDRQPQPEIRVPSIPLRLDTRLLPLTATVITSERTSFSFTANFVDQKIRIEEANRFTPGFNDDETFWTLDGSFNFRLPSRLGVVTLELRNLLDEEFRYRDFNFFTTNPRPQELLPERSAYLKVQLEF
ncbi:TonB-dependent receptor domain-containing protein [Exilibacterium tricleocarpae]|nr:TonB-dependent receptor [Exilibacterium tricleocarpae]